MRSEITLGNRLTEENAESQPRIQLSWRDLSLELKKSFYFCSLFSLKGPEFQLNVSTPIVLNSKNDLRSREGIQIVQNVLSAFFNGKSVKDNF